MEGEDWVFDKFIENPFGGRPRGDYHLTIETAKELAMVEKNEKGQQFRRAALDHLLRSLQRLAGTESGFGCGDVAGFASVVGNGGNISTFFRAPLPPLQPLRNRIRQGDALAYGHVLAPVPARFRW